MVTPVCHFSLVVKPLLISKFLLESERIKKSQNDTFMPVTLGFRCPHFRRLHPLSRRVSFPPNRMKRQETRPELILSPPRSSKSAINHGRFVNVDEGAVEFSFDREACATFIKLPWNEANLMVLYCDLQMREPQYFLYNEILMLLRIEWVLHPAALAAFRFQSKWFIIALLWFVLVFTII